MALDGLELHHNAIRIVPGREEATRNFFGDVLGLHPDPGAREVPGIPLLWMDVGQSHVHLFALEGVSEHARTPDRDPFPLTSPSAYWTSPRRAPSSTASRSCTGGSGATSSCRSSSTTRAAT